MSVKVGVIIHGDGNAGALITGHAVATRAQAPRAVVEQVLKRADEMDRRTSRTSSPT